MLSPSIRLPLLGGRLRALLRAALSWHRRPAPSPVYPSAVVLASAPAADILLVDDDAAIREAFSEALADEGYRVATANDGSDALAYLQVQPAPRLILLDLMMPVLSGWQFLEAQRADATLASIPVVVLSAQELNDHEKNQLHVHLYLRKPISMERLFTIADGYCRADDAGALHQAA